MSNFVFQPTEINNLYLNVYLLSGGIPTYPTDYSAPHIRISHINSSNVEVVDLASTIMVQVSTSNRWFYKYTIPSDADITKYLVTYTTVIELETITNTEEFLVVKDRNAIIEVSTDLVALEYTCVNKTLGHLRINIVDEILTPDNTNKIFTSLYGNWLASPKQNIKKYVNGVPVQLYETTDYTVDLVNGTITFTTAIVDEIKADYTFYPWDNSTLLSFISDSCSEIGVLIWRQIDTNNVPSDYKSPICRRFYTKLLEDLMGESKDYFSISVGGRNINKNNVHTQISGLIDQNEKQLATMLDALRYINKTNRILPLFTKTKDINSNAQIS